MALLRDEPRLVRMLGTLFGTSDRLAELLVRHPEMWEPFLDGLGDRVRSRERALRTAGGADRRRERRRRGRGDGAARASGASRPRRSCASAFTTWPAACRRSRSPRSSAIWRRSASRPGSRRRCRPSRRASASRGRRSPCSASGAWARARCATAPISIWSFSTARPARATTGVDHREWFARASQRFIATMEAMLEEGRLYQVDTRLRPSGEQGLLVTSWASFERYHREESAAWERVALLRARIVWTDEPPAARDERDAGADRTGVRSADRRRRLSGRSPPRAGAGGARAREGAGRLASPPLRSGRDHGRRAPGRARPAAPRRRPGDPHHLDGSRARAAGGARVARRRCATTTPLLRRTALRLRLLLDRPQAVVSPRDLPALARSLGTTATLLAAELDERMARVRAVFAKYF